MSLETSYLARELVVDSESLSPPLPAAFSRRPTLDLATALDLDDPRMEEVGSSSPPSLLHPESVTLALAPHSRSLPRSANSGATLEDSAARSPLWTPRSVRRQVKSAENDGPNSDAFFPLPQQEQHSVENQDDDSLGRRSPGMKATTTGMAKAVTPKRADLAADTEGAVPQLAASTVEMMAHEEIFRWMHAVLRDQPNPAEGIMLDLADGTALHRLITALERCGPLNGFTAQPRTSGQKVQNVRRCLEHLAQHVKRVPLSALSCEEELGRGDQQAAFALVAAIRRAYAHHKP